MKTLHNKRIYTAPELNEIVMDFEISLNLESDPPVGPGDEFAALGAMDQSTFTSFEGI
jgi:hypothetical protein